MPVPSFQCIEPVLNLPPARWFIESRRLGGIREFMHRAGEAVRRFDKVVVGILLTAGGLALALGLGTIIYAYAVVEPKLARVSEQARASLALAERTTRVIDQQAEDFRALVEPYPNITATLRALQGGLEQSVDLSQQTEEALRASANTLREVNENTGLILPDDAFARNARALSALATGFERITPRLVVLRQETDTLTSDLAHATAHSEQLLSAFREANATLEQMHLRLQRARQALSTANLATEITRFAALQGSMFIFLAVVLMGMAGLWMRLLRLVRERPR